MQIQNIHFRLTMLIILAFVSNACSSKPQASNIIDGNISEQPMPTQNQNIDVSQIVGDDVVLSQTVNDITVEVVSVKTINTGEVVKICYTTPDNGEWRPTPGHLIFGTYEIYPGDLGFAPDEKLANGDNTGMRCVSILYHFDKNTLTTSMGLSILDFYAPGREHVYALSGTATKARY